MARLWPFLFLTLAASAQPIIIDTDCGSDDLMAIAFLLAHPTVRIEAVTVANGLVHVDAGARNIVRLLELAGRKDIPVFAGRAAPLRGHNEFPAEWRKTSDELPGVTLPRATRQVERKPAADYLMERLRDKPRAVTMKLLRSSCTTYFFARRYQRAKSSCSRGKAMMFSMSSSESAA